VSNDVMLPDPIRFAVVVSLSFLTAACSGVPGEPLPEVVAPSRPDTLPAEPIPATLDAATDTLNRRLSGNHFHMMQVLREEDAVAAVYPVERWIERHWLDSRGGGLRGELASVGFDDPNDMAAAILRSFWRRLHGSPVDLNGQVRASRGGADVAGRSVLFSAEWTPALSHQCSRRVPMSLTGTWTPDRDTLRRLETGLMPALQAALDRAASPGQRAPRATDYYRQSGGLIVARRRIIYINGFHRAHLSMSGNGAEHAAEWRTHAVNVCDGGFAYFGAEYDPSTDRFESVEFNGR
jgi:hypothetical protein